MNPETLSTERMSLRKITPEIYRELFEHFSDAEIMQFLFLDNNESLQKERNKFDKGLSTHNRTFVLWQMIDNRNGQMLGSCGFHNWHPDHSRAEIGYHVVIDGAKNRGFMTEAVGRILEYGFGEMKLNRIEALVSPDNVPSLKILGKFGFEREGLLRSHYNLDGVFVDSAVFSLLRDDYVKARK